jgi:hypothetical protein
MKAKVIATHGEDTVETTFTMLRGQVQQVGTVTITDMQLGVVIKFKRDGAIVGIRFNDCNALEKQEITVLRQKALEAFEFFEQHAIPD